MSSQIVIFHLSLLIMLLCFSVKMHFSTHTAALKVHCTNNSLLNSSIALKLSSQNNAMTDILY